MLGVYIPHFCYHTKLSVAGNCRMCLVEVEKMPKPVVACAMPVSDGMVVRTKSEMAMKARRGVLEFLLINHPLDCPVCDQGGECALQDLAMKYGPDRSRFHEVKRHAVDKDLGPLIETEMDRCIHCTRCVRFTMEIAGTEDMGGMFRGDHMQIGTYVEKALGSELVGNLAELCPVGALNDKPFHFQARGWELKRAPGVCIGCSVGCNLEWHHLDHALKRVKARSCDAINETWLCDKGRYLYDGLTVDRLAQPMVRRGSGHGALQPVSWPEALDRAAVLLKGVRPDEVAGLADAAGQSAEDMFAFQDFLRQVVGTRHVDHRLQQRDFSADRVPLTRADLLMNTSMVDLEASDLVLLVGMDPRFEVPLLGARLRKAALRGARVLSIYPRQLDSVIPGLQGLVVSPGDEVGLLDAVLARLSGDDTAGDPVAGTLAAALQASQRAVVLLGDYAIQHPQAEAIRRRTVALLKGCGREQQGFNRVSSVMNAAAAQDFGLVPHRGPGYRRLDTPGRDARGILEAMLAGEIKVLFLLGGDPTVDAVNTALARAALGKAAVIYLGAFDTPAARLAQVVLPGLALPEKTSTLTNVEGRPQRVARAIRPQLAEAKEDWRVLRALSDYFPTRLGYDTLEGLQGAMAAADHRYNVEQLAAAGLAPSCDHSPVTSELSLDAVAPVDAAGAGGGVRLVLEKGFYRDSLVVRRSAIARQLDGGLVVRIHPHDAGRLGVADGQRVRITQGGGAVEVVLSLDDRVAGGTLLGLCGYPEAGLQDLAAWDGFVAVNVVHIVGV